MKKGVKENMAEEIITSGEIVAAEQEFTSSRRKVFAKYTIAITLVVLISLLTYLFLSA